MHSMGGLGNQLFIYAAGLACADRTGAHLRVDSSLQRDDPNRPFLLKQLGLPAEYLEMHPSQPLSHRVLRRPPVPSRCNFQESSFRYDESAIRQPAGSCLFGYFQSWRYVNLVATKLREQFRRLQEERSRNPAYLEARRLIVGSGAIAVHVRRGDYLSPATRIVHGTAGHTYYGEAVSVLRRMGYGEQIVLFSDDVETSLPEMRGLGRVEAVQRFGLDAIDEMLLMSEASALVGGNSSFSWWSGWIGEQARRPVICPRPWFEDPSLDTRDLLPPSWLTLQR